MKRLSRLLQFALDVAVGFAFMLAAYRRGVEHAKWAYYSRGFDHGLERAKSCTCGSFSRAEYADWVCPVHGHRSRQVFR